MLRRRPAWASPSVLPSQGRGGPHRGHPADETAVRSANPAPCPPPARGCDIPWGLSLVTPPNLQTSISDQEPRISFSPSRTGVSCWPDLGSELRSLPPPPPQMPQPGMPRVRMKILQVLSPQLTRLISNFISFAKTDFLFLLLS